MTTILHAASAYPDPIAPETSASSLLLALNTEALTHHVYSFKRAGWRGGPVAVSFDDAAGTDHRAIAYGAPPKGLAMARRLSAVAGWIIKDAEDRGLRPDVIHAHKVSLDGFVGAQLAAHFNVPLMLSVQANSDARIIKVRRDLLPRFRQIWHGAAMVYPFAPVAYDTVAALLGPRDGPRAVLPCPTRADDMHTPTPRAEGAPPVILTAFHLAHYGNKNIKTLLEATAQAAAQIPDIQLQIIGGGDAEAFLTISQMADQIAPGRVTLLGARPGDQMQARMRAATAFAMISHRESYGMVYAEALLAGTPCLHSKGRAIDGLFEDGQVTLGVDPGSVTDVAAALVRLCQEEPAFKDRVARAQEDGTLNILRRETIAQTYQAGVTTALTAPPFTASRAGLPSSAGGAH